VKLLLDQNLSRRLISQIEDLYPGSARVADGRPDAPSDLGAGGGDQ
jgi:hypothetical protein